MILDVFQFKKKKLKKNIFDKINNNFQLSIYLQFEQILKSYNAMFEFRI